MSEDRHEQSITSRIDGKLFGQSSSFSEQRIFRVHSKLRSQNEEAYEPQMFSFGPYHHGKPNLRKAEGYKLWYLKELLHRRGELSTGRYIDALTKLEGEARSWYAEEDMIDLATDEFMEMMLLDGCFIIEVLRKFGALNQHKDYEVNYSPNLEVDPIYMKPAIMGCLSRDILLIENQLPFFVLLRLFDMTKSSEEEDLIDLATFPSSLLNNFFPSDNLLELPTPAASIVVNVEKVVHLLHLVHLSWCWSVHSKSFPSAVPCHDGLGGDSQSQENGDSRSGHCSDQMQRSAAAELDDGNWSCCSFAVKVTAADHISSLKNGHIPLQQTNSPSCWNFEKMVPISQLDKVTSILSYCFTFAKKLWSKANGRDSRPRPRPGPVPEGDVSYGSGDDEVDYELIKCASDLQGAGIKFEKAHKNVSWLDISFRNGVMKIPTLKYEEVTECLFRNLIAFELYKAHAMFFRRYVTDYVRLMDCLIDSSTDVENLRQQKIINKGLGDDETISSVFNKLMNEVVTDGIDKKLFGYWSFFEQVNRYSSRRWNTWRSHLMRNYFNNPWSIVSSAAALVLLLLTVLQTLFSILQYTTDQPSCKC